MLTGTPVRRCAKRSEALQTRLTAEEHAALRRLSVRTGIRASRLSRKAIRELVTGGVDLLNREQQAVLELARQIRLAGINLNQIARHLNRGDSASRSLAETRGPDRKRIHLAPPGCGRTGTDSAGAWP